VTSELKRDICILKYILSKLSIEENILNRALCPWKKTLFIPTLNFPDHANIKPKYLKLVTVSMP